MQIFIHSDTLEGIIAYKSLTLKNVQLRDIEYFSVTIENMYVHCTQECCIENSSRTSKFLPHVLFTEGTTTVLSTTCRFEQKLHVVVARFFHHSKNPLVWKGGLKSTSQQKSTIRVQVNNRPISGIQVTLSIGFKAKMFFQSLQWRTHRCRIARHEDI